MTRGMSKEEIEENYNEGFHFARGIIDAILTQFEERDTIEDIAEILAHIELAKERCKLDIKKEVCKVVPS